MQFTQTKWIKEYFSFTKKERNAILLLGTLAVLFALLPTMFPFLVKNEIELVVDTALQNEITALQVVNEPTDRRTTASYTDADLYQPKQSRFEKFRNEQSSAVLFTFDPNTASAGEWKQLGLRDKTIQTILNYRSKGGKFFKPEDLQRIYGLRPDDYERLKPYIQIASQRKEQPSTFVTTETKVERKEYVAAAIDINTADTAEWKKLKGIGSGYARRIVNFRSKLGGFVSIEQVKETYGLPDSVFQQIKPQLRFDASTVQQIDLNKASLEQLKAHPYISYSVANAIIQYRHEHGEFSTVADIRKIGAIDASLFTKIAPYFTIK